VLLSWRLLVAARGPSFERALSLRASHVLPAPGEKGAAPAWPAHSLPCHSLAWRTDADSPAQTTNLPGVSRKGTDTLKSRLRVRLTVIARSRATLKGSVGPFGAEVPYAPLTSNPCVFWCKAAAMLRELL
jgi:hypothetical protein